MPDTTLSLTHFANLEGKQHPDLLEPLTNERISELTGLTAKRVFQSTGMDTRYIMSKGRHPLDLARRVMERFYAQSGITPQQIGALAFSHTCYDKIFAEEMADTLGKELHLPKENVLGRSYGCAGFPDILQIAGVLAEQLPSDRHCLVLNVETPQLNKDARDKYATPIFAAGATATTLWKGPGHQLLFADVDDIVPANNPKKEKFFTVANELAEDFWGEKQMRMVSHMNGNLVYTNGLETIERAARESLERVLNMGHLGHRIVVVPHQPNGKMVQMFVDVDGPAMTRENDGKVISVEWVNGMNGMGNTISATIPSVLARLWKLLPGMQKGEIVLFPAAGICVENPEDKMSMGHGAMIWNPGGYREAS